MNIKTVDIKGKEYVEVSERIRVFRKMYKGYCLISKIIKHENGFILIEACVLNEDGVVVANGHAYEKENSTFINKTSYIVEVWIWV